MKKTKDENSNDEDDILGRLQERVEKAIATIQELRRERDEIRDRIESILSNLESLDA